MTKHTKRSVSALLKPRRAYFQKAWKDMSLVERDAFVSLWNEAKKSSSFLKNEIQKHKEGSELYHWAMHRYHKNMAIVTGDKKHKELSEKHFEISDHLGRVKEHLSSMNLPKFHPYNQRYTDQANERLAKLRADLASVLFR